MLCSSSSASNKNMLWTLLWPNTHPNKAFMVQVCYREVKRCSWLFLHVYRNILTWSTVLRLTKQPGRDTYTQFQGSSKSLLVLLLRSEIAIPKSSCQLSPQATFNDPFSQIRVVLHDIKMRYFWALLRSSTGNIDLILPLLKFFHVINFQAGMELEASPGPVCQQTICLPKQTYHTQGLLPDLTDY